MTFSGCCGERKRLVVPSGPFIHLSDVTSLIQNAKKCSNATERGRGLLLCRRARRPMDSNEAKSAAAPPPAFDCILLAAAIRVRPISVEEHSTYFDGRTDGRSETPSCFIFMLARGSRVKKANATANERGTRRPISILSQLD